MKKKVCPLNSFGPCRPNDCLFHMDIEGGYEGCVILDHYAVSLLSSARLLDITAGLAASLPQLSSELHGAELREHVDAAIARLEYMRVLLKEIP